MALATIQVGQSMIKFAPSEVVAARTTCSICKSAFRVPLERSFQHSLAPVMPKDFDAKSNNNFWQLQAVEVDCPSCSRKTMLRLPTAQERGKVLFYGDDAYRTSTAGNVFCFSLVGGSPSIVNQLGQELHSLKQTYEPDLIPKSWHLHMKVLHSGDNRQKNKVFQSWNRSKIQSFIAELFDLHSRYADEVFIFNASFSGRPTDSIDDLKKDCYLALVADLIYGFSKLGFTPLLHFDSEKELTGLGPIIHGWAKDAFQKSQRELIYSFISHGLPIPEPLFLPPASHPCLELADFVSFVVARGHHCKLRGIPFDYPSEQLGKVFYSWLRRDGHYGRNRVIGFPWSELYS